MRVCVYGCCDVWMYVDGIIHAEGCILACTHAGDCVRACN